LSSGSRHAAPVFVRKDGGGIVPLELRPLGRTEFDGGRREEFVQTLVHDRPEVIPTADIEPAFTPLISICTELPTAAGFLDNLWITPEGGIVLGECKLVRNPQARREVVAQALDYARAIARWHFEDLEGAVRIALKDPTATLWSRVKDESDLEESQFVDAVERRLRVGRFMILVIGDGVQEGAEALASYLQMHAGLHAGLALVDLSIWHGIDGGLLVVPRIPLRTVLVERGIVLVDPSAQVRIQAAQASQSVDSRSSPKPMSLSEPEFYERLEERRPGLSSRLKSFVETLGNIGITPDFRRSVVLQWHPSPDVAASAGYVEVSGKFWPGDTVASTRRLGHPEAGEHYLEAVAAAIGGTVRRYEKGMPQVMGPDGKPADVASLLDVTEAWAQALERLIAEAAPPEV